MKTMTLAKSIFAIVVVCFTLTGTTSCKKTETIAPAPQKVIDQKLVGLWKKTITSINSNGRQEVTEETFRADGTGVERGFTSNRGVIQDERITTFDWTVKSEGVLHIKTSNNEEGDVTYSFTNSSNTKMDLQLPSGDVMSFGKVN